MTKVPGSCPYRVHSGAYLWSVRLIGWRGGVTGTPTVLVNGMPIQGLFGDPQQRALVGFGLAHL